MVSDGKRRHLFARSKFFSNIPHAWEHHPAASPLPPFSPNSFVWLKRGRRCVQISLLAPIRGSVPIKIWDIAGLSLWCLSHWDFFLGNSRADRCRRPKDAAGLPQGSTHHPLYHLMRVRAWSWRQAAKRAIFSADILTFSSRKSTGVINTINNVATVNLGEFQGRIVISNTCAFLATTRRNICLKMSLAVKNGLLHIIYCMFERPGSPTLVSFWMIRPLLREKYGASMLGNMRSPNSERIGKPKMRDEELSDTVWSQPEV